MRLLAPGEKQVLAVAREGERRWYGERVVWDVGITGMRRSALFSAGGEVCCRVA